MYTYEYPRPAVTADTVVFAQSPSEGLMVLLVRRGKEPYKDSWAFPGGFMNIDEDAETCARRELEEETGLQVSHIIQVGAFTAVDRDPRGRVMTVAYAALTQLQPVEGRDDASEASWFPINHLPPLAFDHEEILRKTLSIMNL